MHPSPLLIHPGRTSRIVLITGASSGIGRATAELFAAHGSRVFATSRQPHASEGGIEMLPLDVRSEESVTRCVDDVLARAGRIDVLINNAAIEHLGIAEETTLDDAHNVFETNFFGVARMIDAVLPGMRRRRQGRIINVGSLAAWIGEPGEAFYAASKGALARYTEALRHEVWPLGVHVSLVEPGAFRTRVVEAASYSEGTIADYDGIREAVHRTMQSAAAHGGDPRKAARQILKIASTRAPRSRYGAGAEARWLPYLKVLLPQRLFDALLRRGFGLEAKRDP